MQKECKILIPNIPRFDREWGLVVGQMWGGPSLPKVPRMLVLRSPASLPTGSNSIVVVDKNRKKGKAIGVTVTTVNYLLHMLTIVIL